MKLLGKSALFFVILFIFGFIADYFNVAAKERRLSAAVSEIGGRNGSIQFWPFGAEYRITLTRVPSDEELKQLAVANTMRGVVKIAFEECEISSAEKDR